MSYVIAFAVQSRLPQPVIFASRCGQWGEPRDSKATVQGQSLEAKEPEHATFALFEYGRDAGHSIR